MRIARKKFVGCRFDPEQLDLVTKWATRYGLNQSQALRALVTRGLDVEGAA